MTSHEAEALAGIRCGKFAVQIGFLFQQSSFLPHEAKDVAAKPPRPIRHMPIVTVAWAGPHGACVYPPHLQSLN